MNTPDLSGRLTLYTGKQIDFCVDGAAVDTVIKQLHGGKIFTRPALTLAATQSLIACPGSSIVRLDLAEHPLVRAEKIEPLPSGHSRREVTSDEWHVGTTQMEAEGVSRLDRVGTPGANITVFGRLGLVNGDTLYLRHELPTPELFEQRRFLATLFSQHAFVFERVTGGVTLLNPAHILLTQYHPGAAPTTDTWQVSQFQLL